MLFISLCDPSVIVRMEWSDGDDDMATEVPSMSGHLHRLRHDRQLRRAAKHEMRKLHAYRVERASAQRLEREAHELLAQQSAEWRPPHKCQPAHQDRYIDNGCLGVLNGAEGFSSPAAALTWRNHELRWATFVEAPPASILYHDVPWPPDASSDLLMSITAYSTDMQHGNEARAEGAAQPVTCAVQLAAARDANSIDRRAHRLATLRWHPDKFEQRFGSALAAADRVRILQRTQEVCQGLNDMRPGPSN